MKNRNWMKYMVVGLLVMALLLSGCSADTPKQETDMDADSVSGQAEYSDKSPEEVFEVALEQASAVVYAQVVSNEKEEGSNDITFQILDTYAGDLGVKEFAVEDTMMGSSGINFDIGNRYVFPIYQIANIYRGGERYVFLGVAVEYDKNDNYIQSNLSTGQDIKFSNTSRTALSAAVEKKAVGTGMKGMDYVRSDNLKDIVAGSQCIAQIKVGELFDTHYIDIYDVEVIKTFKGDAASLEKVMFFKDTVKTGEEYIALLMIDDIGFGWFATENNCLIPVSDTEKVEEVLRLIDETK